MARNARELPEAMSFMLEVAFAFEAIGDVTADSPESDEVPAPVGQSAPENSYGIRSPSVVTTSDLTNV